MSFGALRRPTANRGNSRAQASGATGARRTVSVPRTEFARPSQKYVADQIADALAGYSEGDIARAVECTKDTAQSWKLGRRAANTSYTLAMGRVFDEVGMLLAEEADLGRFYNRDERLLQALRRISLQEDQEGQFARKWLRDIGAAQ